jgi:hypothetical protein
MRVVSSVVAVLMPWVLACAPEPDPNAATGACGEEGPIQLLEYAPKVATQARMFEGDLLVNLYRDDGLPFTPVEAWRVGTCGDPQIRLAEGFSVHATASHLVGCDPENPRVYLIDPRGEHGPVALMETSSCGGFATPYGLLAADGDRGLLLLYRSPVGHALPPEVLLDGLVDFFDVRAPADGHFAYAITSEGPESPNTLERVSLVDGAIETLASDVVDYWLTPTGAHVLWSRPTGETSDVYRVVDIHILDLSSGEDETVATDVEQFVPSDDLWPYALVKYPESASILNLRNRTMTELLRSPGGLMGRTPDGMLLVSHYLGAQFFVDIYVESQTDDGLRPARTLLQLDLRGARALSVSTADDGVQVRVVDESGVGELRLYPYDGSPSRVLAPDVGDFARRLPDDRVLFTVVDEGDDDGLVELRLWDPEAEHSTVIDEVTSVLDPSPDGDILYSIVEGERRGLWRAGIPPRSP